MARTKTYTAHYISGTHWDREWYRPFQEYRVLFVELVDSLLEQLAKDRAFKVFHFDGQTCVLEDYCDIRPENRSRLQRFMKQGRILVGPWFTMPDLFGPGDEALVRNLLMGQRISRAWGVEPMPVAYTCDMFGHPSQMPQIYQGFGMPYCILGRGTNEHTTPAFFHWQAPDGTSVLCFKLQDKSGYGAFVSCRQQFENLAAPDEPKPRQSKEEEEAGVAKTKEILRQYVEHEKSRTNGSALCLIDALDHTPPSRNVKQYMALLQEVCPDVEAKHSSLPAFFAEAAATARRVPTRRGELREPAKERCGYLYLIPNTVSSRVRMKQANDRCQMLLDSWAEPLMALANLHGAKLPERYLEEAWKHVLLNHAHDSICGCSIDQVHRDMMYRYDQAEMIAQEMRHRAFGALTRDRADLAQGEDDFTLSLFNPTCVARQEVVCFDVELPGDFPATQRDNFSEKHPIKSFVLHDVNGKVVPYQRLHIEPLVSERSRYSLFQYIGETGFARYTVAAEVSLPAFGFTSLRVSPAERPVRRMGSLRTGPAAAENKHLAIEIQPNGCLTLKDKKTGQTYTDLLTFEDCSETGDGWFHVPANNDKVVLSSASPAQVSVVHDGPEVVTFAVEIVLQVPRRHDVQTHGRDQDRVPLPITSRISLRRNAKTVEVETEIDNQCEEHRVRLLLPTDASGAKTWVAHHPYDLVQRPVARDHSTHDWQEVDLEEKPFLGLQAVGAGKRGLAFLSAGGLHEGGVGEDERRTLCVTLLRSFRNTVGTRGESDGLEQGLIRLRYALMPFAGTLPEHEALQELQALERGVLVRQTGKVCSGYPAMRGTAGPEVSFLAQQRGTLHVRNVKPAEDGSGRMVIRLWNPTKRKQTETLSFWRTIKRAQYVMLNEAPVKGKAPKVKGKTLTVEAGPREIVSVMASVNRK